MPRNSKTMYDLMRESENREEDACYPEEWIDEQKLTDKEKYFDFYDDIKLTPKDDWWKLIKGQIKTTMKYFHCRFLYIYKKHLI